MIKLTGKLLKKIIKKPLELFNDIAISRFPEEAIQIQLEDMDRNLDCISREYANAERDHKDLSAELKEEEVKKEIKESIKECLVSLEELMKEKIKEIKQVKENMKRVKVQIIKLQTKKRVLLIKQRALELKNNKFKSEIGIADSPDILSYMDKSVKKIEDKIRAYEVKLN